MDTSEATRVVEEVIDLVTARYVFPDIAGTISGTLRDALAAGRYTGGGRPGAAGDGPIAAAELAGAVTEDLQSVNGDRHLRLLYHPEPLPERTRGDHAAEYEAMTAWAARTGGGVGRVERLAGNVGYLDLRPLLFPAAIAAEQVTAAMTLVADAGALIIDLRNCLGGEPAMVAFLVSYLVGTDPVELTGTYQRDGDRITQSWTLPAVPGRRFGPAKPVYVLTSGTTFSGGEALAFDLQRLSRATIVGERTRGGAHPRVGVRLHPHLEITIPVARAVDPVGGGNWEAVGVAPDVEVPAGQALDAAYRTVLAALAAGGAAGATEAREALDSLDSLDSLDGLGDPGEASGGEASGGEPADRTGATVTPV